MSFPPNFICASCSFQDWFPDSSQVIPFMNQFESSLSKLPYFQSVKRSPIVKKDSIRGTEVEVALVRRMEGIVWEEGMTTIKALEFRLGKNYTLWCSAYSS